MSREKKININKNRFKVPEGYFESISSDNLLFPKKKSFKIPLNYFETLEFNYSKIKSKSKSYLIKNIIYSGIAAIFIIGIASNLYFKDSNNFSEDEIFSYLNYELVDHSISEYSELFDETIFEVKLNNFSEYEYEYLMETYFINDHYLIFE
ncbi:MAG: hypothetical protein ISP56_01065 [Flavobacteriaceae bacterium]|nr:hypothetical protein [Flavobacteriaceae bacterium]